MKKAKTSLRELLGDITPEERAEAHQRYRIFRVEPFVWICYTNKL